MQILRNITAHHLIQDDRMYLANATIIRNYVQILSAQKTNRFPINTVYVYISNLFLDRSPLKYNAAAKDFRKIFSILHIKSPFKQQHRITLHDNICSS